MDGRMDGLAYIFSVISATIIIISDAIVFWLYCATDSSGNSVALLERAG